MKPFKKLDFYLIREIFPPVMGGLVIFTMMFLVSTFFEIAQMIVQRGIPARLVLGMLMLSLPSVVFVTLPMATLLGVLLGFGRMYVDSEIVALRAAGLTTARIVRAPLVFGLILGGLSFYMGNTMIPNARFELGKIQREALKSANLLGMVQERVFFDLIPGMVMYVDRVDKENAKLFNLFLYQENSESGASVTTAKQGQLFLDDDKETLIFQLREGKTISFAQDDRTKVQETTFETHQFRASNPYSTSWRRTAMGQYRAGLRELTFGKLYQRYLENKDLNLPKEGKAKIINPIVMELYRRFTLPLAIPIFVLLAVPMSMGRVRTTKSTSFALCIGIILVYWMLDSSFTTMSSKGQISGHIAGIVPTAVFLLWALYLLSRRNKPAESRLSVLFASLYFHVRPYITKLIPRSSRTHATAGLDELEEDWLEEASRTTFPRRMDVHISKVFLHVLGLVFFSLFVLFTIIEVRELVDNLAQSTATTMEVALFVAARLPAKMVEFSGLSALMATLLTFGILNRNSEITAYKASGVSVYRLATPVVLLILVLTLGIFSLENWVTPVTNRVAEDMESHIKGRKIGHGQKSSGVWTMGQQENVIQHHTLYNNYTKTIHGFAQFYLARNPFRLDKVVYGERVDWEKNRWIMHGGWQRSFGEGNGFEEMDGQPVANLEAPSRDWSERLLGSERMSFAQFKENIDIMHQRGYGVTPLKVAYYRKWTQTCLSLVMLMVALPFSFQGGRRSSFGGVGLALMLFLIYYILMALFTALGEANFLPPALAAWAASIFFSAGGAYLFLNVRT